MKKKLSIVVAMVLAAVISITSTMASDHVATQPGSIGNCQITAKNTITENLLTATAMTSTSGVEYGPVGGVTATFYYVKVSGANIGSTGMYHGQNGGSLGGVYSKDVPDYNYRFYRSESSHSVSYQNATFSANLVVVP